MLVLRTVNSSCAGANEQIVKEEMGACNESENESYYEKTWGSVYGKNRKYSSHKDKQSEQDDLKVKTTNQQNNHLDRKRKRNLSSIK